MTILTSEQKCTFCDAPAVTSKGVLLPQLCQQHCEMAAMVGIMEGKSTGVTIPGIKRMIVEIEAGDGSGTMSMTEAETPRLLWDFLKSAQRIWRVDGLESRQW